MKARQTQQSDLFAKMPGFKFVGDLSREDAAVLEGLGRISNHILEFGAGGSTQIFAQCQPKSLTVVETAEYWLKLTAYRIDQFPSVTKPDWVKYGDWPEKSYDLIFVDGIDSLRKEFAFRSWRSLANNGFLVFHDTRREPDISIVSAFAAANWNEISLISPNYHNSNCTVIIKKPFAPYVNWQEVEGKEPHEYGLLSESENEIFNNL